MDNEDITNKDKWRFGIMHSQRKSGAILSYINIICKNLVNFMYTPFLLKYIGQGDYGLFQMTNSVIMSLSLLSMGFSSAYVRFYIKFKTDKDLINIKKLNGMYLLLFCFISLLSLIIGAFLVFNVEHIFTLNTAQVGLMKRLMAIMILNVALTFPSSVFDANIMVNQQFVYQQGRQLMQTILVPLIAVPLIFLGSGVLVIGITQTLVTLLFLIMNMRLSVKKLNMKFKFTNLNFEMFKEVFVFSFFIFLNQIVDLVNNNGPNFILGIYKGASEVATFAIAIQIKNLFFMMSTSLSNVFIPKVNELVSKNARKDVLTDLMIKIGRIQMLILLFVLGGFIVVGPYFIHLWAGDRNSLAYWLVILMVFPSIVPLSQNIGIEIQRAMNKHIFRSISYIIFAFINIIVTVIGTKYFGLVGSSMGYIISIVCANGFLMNWYYQKKMSLNMVQYWKKTLNLLLPFIVSIGILLISQNFIAIISMRSFFIYGLMYVFIFGIIYIFLVATNYEKNILFRRQ